MCRPSCVKLARPAGFEPTTPWFVGSRERITTSLNQELVALAIRVPRLIKAQFGHIQFDVGTAQDMASWLVPSAHCSVGIGICFEESARAVSQAHRPSRFSVSEVMPFQGRWRRAIDFERQGTMMNVASNTLQIDVGFITVNTGESIHTVFLLLNTVGSQFRF